MFLQQSFWRTTSYIWVQATQNNFEIRIERLSALRLAWWSKYDRRWVIHFAWEKSYMVQVSGGRIIWYTSWCAPRHPESTPEVTLRRDTVLKNLWLVCHWKHCDRTGQRKISWSTSRQPQDYCVKRIYFAYVSHLVNGKGDLFCKVFLCWLHQQD